jgi:hypothetical protein
MPWQSAQEWNACVKARVPCDCNVGDVEPFSLEAMLRQKEKVLQDGWEA